MTVMTPRALGYQAEVAERIATRAPEAIAGRVRALVHEHEAWRTRCLNLLASENAISPQALALLGSSIATRLTEGFPGDKEFPPPRQNVQIDEIEAILIALARRLIPARYLEWRATSNTMANAMALEAVCSPGDRILAQSLRGGGNMSYHPGAVPDLLGLSVVELPWGPDLGLDLEGARRVALAERPAAIVVGGSYLLFPLPVPELRAIADEVGAALIFDAAHVGLLIATGLFPHPLAEGADLLTMGTHKIMGGPIGGLVFTDREDLAERIINRAHPLFLQTRDQNKYAAAAHTLAELVEFGPAYAARMVANARALAGALEARGFVAVGRERGYTMTHQVLVDAGPGGGALFEERCQTANILINRAQLLRDHRDGTVQSWVRITVQEVTRQGMTEPDMERIAELISRAVRATEPAETVAAQVAALAAEYAGMAFTFSSEAVAR